jgi:hypothetical protein
VGRTQAKVTKIGPDVNKLTRGSRRAVLSAARFVTRRRGKSHQRSCGRTGGEDAADNCAVPPLLGSDTARQTSNMSDAIFLIL